MRVGQLRTIWTMLAGPACGAALVLALGTSPSGWGGPPPVDVAAAATGADDRAEQQGPPDTGGSVEGIKVHGDWTIVVRDPDGTVASRHEFENALTSSGADRLFYMLHRYESVGPWRMLLSGTPTPCVDRTRIQQPVTCEIPGQLTGFLGVFRLQGTATADRDGAVGTVATEAFFCGGGIVSPALCTPDDEPTGQWRSFTNAALSSPIPVRANQSFDVTVQITFR